MFEPTFYLGRGKVRWGSVLFFFGLATTLAILSSCGSSTSTTATPTVTMSCTPADVQLLGTAQCTATVLNESSTLVNWSVSGATGAPTGLNFGSITSAGLYTAPAVIPGSTQQFNAVTITATSQVLSTLTATQGLTLILPTNIANVTCVDSLLNLAPTVSSGNQISCTATSSTNAAVPVNWSVTDTNFPAVTNPAILGSISAQGIYSAPLVPPPGQSVTITATSQASATLSLSTKATVVYGNAVLSGQYVFSTNGRLPTHPFWARAGSFSAGGGTISGGLEDTNQGGSPNIVNNKTVNTSPPSPRTFTGSYSIGPDGRGTMQFCEDTNSSCPQGGPATAYFSIVVVSPKLVQIAEFSKPGTASANIVAGGEMISQDQAVFSAGPGVLSGTYSFNFAGVSTGATEESVLGQFNANGHGAISAGAANVPGEIDINPTPGSLATLLPGTAYTVSSNGRGTMTLNGFTFSFYPVSSNRAKFIEIDAPAAPATTPDSILLGDAYLQQTSVTCGWGLNALSGSTAFEISGLNASGSLPGVAIADVGTFTADGVVGNVTAASIDENSGGTISSAVGTLAGSYTMDTCGRGTLAIGAHSYVFYIISPSDAVLQETTTGIISHGFLVPSQGGTFANATLTGSYAFRLGGTDAAGTTGNREDFLGQVTSAGTGTGLAGKLDLNDFGATQTPVAITNGTYLPSGGLRATMSLPLATTPSATTRSLVLYMISPTLFYALDVDTTGMAVGAIYNQF